MSNKRDEFIKAGKDALTNAREDLTKQAAEHEDTIREKIGKVAGFLDEKTGGKYTEKIDKAQQKIEGGVGKAAAEGRGHADAGDPPGSEPGTGTPQE